MAGAAREETGDDAGPGRAPRGLHDEEVALRGEPRREEPGAPSSPKGGPMAYGSTFRPPAAAPAEKRGAPLQRGAIVVVLLASTANALNQGDRSIMSMAVIPMASEFGWSLAEKGWILSSFALGYIIVQIPSGWISTHLPPLALLSVAVLCWSLITVLTPAAAHVGVPTLIASRALLGIAEGACLPAAYQLLTLHLPPRMHSRGFACVLGGGACGYLLTFVACSHMALWTSMFYRFGLVGICWFLLSGLVAGVECPHLILASGEAEARQALTAGGQAGTADCKSLGGGGELAARPASFWVRLATSSPVLAICAAHFGQNWTNYTLATWLPTYLHEVLGVPVSSLWISALPYLVWGLASIVFGQFADAAIARKAYSVAAVRRAATALGLLGPAVCHILFAMASSQSTAVPLLMLSYLLGSATSSGYMANHADITSGYAGFTFAVANTVATVPGILAGPVTAAIVSAYDSWFPVFALAATINTVCACAYVVFAKTDRIL